MIRAERWLLVTTAAGVCYLLWALRPKRIVALTDRAHEAFHRAAWDLARRESGPDWGAMVMPRYGPPQRGGSYSGPRAL